MNALRSPLASRPVKAFVTTVGRSPVDSAARWVAEVPASGESINTVPTATTAAPATMAARTVVGSAIPPAAIIGSSDAEPTWATSSSSRACGNGGRRGVSVPQWPPAADDCTASASSQAAFVGGRDRLYQQAAYGAERIDNGPLGNSEGERDNRHPCIDEQIDLVPPRIVVLDRVLRQGDTQPVGIGSQRLAISLIGRAIDRNWIGSEQVHPEVWCLPANRVDLRLDRLGRLVPGGEKPDAAGSICRHNEVRSSWAASHRRSHDRHRQPKLG